MNDLHQMTPEERKHEEIELEKMQELREDMAEECDHLHCPDYCSGQGFCSKCILEEEIGELDRYIALSLHRLYPDEY